MATKIDKITLTDSISLLITLKLLVSRTTLNGHNFLYLTNFDQSEIESTQETKSHKIDDGPVKSTALLSTLNKTPQIPIQTETPVVQNVKQIYKPSAQLETLIFETFQELLMCHLEKRVTPLTQEKFESYFEKISKIFVNTEYCQHENNEILQQNMKMRI